MKDNKIQKLVLAGVVVILILFTLFGFFIKQPCDLDAVYLWCRLHPLSIGDILGLILFYGGALGIGGITNLLGIRLMGNENTVGKWPFVFVGAAIAGIVLIWNT